MPWPQLTLVAGNHSSIALGGKDGVKVRPGVAVDLLLVGDDGVELGGVELVTGACGGGGEGHTRVGAAGQGREAGSGSAPVVRVLAFGRAWWHAPDRWSLSLAQPCLPGERSLTHDSGGLGVLAAAHQAATNNVVACRHGAGRQAAFMPHMMHACMYRDACMYRHGRAGKLA